MLNGVRNPVLRSLEDLAALTDNTGLVHIRPFRDWKNASKWQNSLFTLRLCNAGEGLDIATYLNSVPETARTYAMKLETVIRMIYEINNTQIASDEEVSTFSQQFGKTLTRIDYLRLWITNVEKVVVDRLYSIYEQLQEKQKRLINGQFMCEITGDVYTDFPEKAIVVHNCLGEILTEEGIRFLDNDLTMYGDDIAAVDSVSTKQQTLNESSIEDKVEDPSDASESSQK